MSDSFAIVRRGISIEYIRVSRRDAALAALDSIEAENERLREALWDTVRTYCEDVCPDTEQMEGYVNGWLTPLGLSFKTHMEASAALARIPESKES